MNRDVAASIEVLSVGPVVAPDRACEAGSFCLFRAEGAHLEFSVTITDPLDGERARAESAPVGFVEARVTLRAD